MTDADVARASRIKYEDRDCYCLLFSTESWTRGPSVIHHLTADFAPEAGIITCQCETGRIHKRWIDILTGEGDPCKHIRACHQLCKRILEQGF